MVKISLLLPDHLEQFRVLVNAVAAMPDFDSACRLLVERVSTILEVPVALLVGRGAGWRVQAAHGNVRAPNGDVPAAALRLDVSSALEAAVASRPTGSEGPVSALIVDGGGHWTQVALHDSGKYHVRLLLQGEWTLSAPTLQEWALRVSGAFERLPIAPWSAPNRRMVTTHTFARRLSRITDPGQLHQTIADTFARAVRAEKSSLALFDRTHNLLTIAATSGYAGVLVRHLRIRPGSGIIGAVYRSARPLLVANVRALPDAPTPRLRYRTPSFISLPLVGADDVLGVMSVADRRDAQAFQRRDLNELRGLAAIAALALERNDAVRAARDSARLAAVDPVTGLFNRRQLHLRLDEEIERARRQQAPLTALMLDVECCDGRCGCSMCAPATAATSSPCSCRTAGTTAARKSPNAFAKALKAAGRAAGPGPTKCGSRSASASRASWPRQARSCWRGRIRRSIWPSARGGTGSWSARQPTQRHEILAPLMLTLAQIGKSFIPGSPSLLLFVVTVGVALLFARPPRIRAPRRPRCRTTRSTNTSDGCITGCAGGSRSVRLAASWPAVCYGSLPGLAVRHYSDSSERRGHMTHDAADRTE